MKNYKVIKPFNNAIKGDTFFCDPEYGENIYQLERNEYKDGFQSTVYMEMSKDVLDEFVKQGYLVECNEEDTDTEDSQLSEVLDYVESLINQYTEDYNNMLKSFEDGDIQPCVKVEAETVYYNLNKVLNAIKNKINEQIG